MIQYLAIKKDEEDYKLTRQNTYGICACVMDSGFIEILACVDHISKDIAWVKALANKLNQFDVDPIHLCDIIEDELYEMRA